MKKIPVLAIFFAAALLLPSMVHADSKTPPTGICSQASKTCIKFELAPANNCQSSTVVDGKKMTFSDNITVTLFQLFDNGTLSSAGPNATGPAQFHYLSTNTTWNVQAENDFFKQPFNCFVKMGPSGWQFTNRCDQQNSKGLDNCTGCLTLNAPGGGTALIAPGCVFQDLSAANYHNVYLLDKQGKNLLFRGPRPTVWKNGAWKFDNKGLFATMASRYQYQVADGSTFPDTFHFVDISLISNEKSSNAKNSEHDVLMAEYTFFKGTADNPPAYLPQPSSGFATLNKTVDGKFYWWNMLPGADGAQSSYLPKLINNITAMMQSTDDVPYVIYFHCDAGSDRTGEVASSYMLSDRTGSDTKDAYIYGTTVFKNPDNGDYSFFRQIPVSDFGAGAVWYCQTKYGSSCNYNNTTSYPQKGCLYPWQSGCSWAQ
jgi:hypothetical protein